MNKFYGKSWLPTIVIKHKSSWFRTAIIEQHTMIGPIDRHFSHLATVIGRVSVVQFLTFSVYCQAEVLS